MAMHLRQRFLRSNVVITGGSSGIGRSMAIQLVQLGANVFIIARRQALLDETLVELEKHRVFPDQVMKAYSADIGDREAITATMQEIVWQHDVDVLINNAAIAYANYLEETPPEKFEELMRINFLGMVWTTTALIPHFKKRRKGHIANVSSGLGILGVIGYAAYAPSKYAVHGFSDVLRSELLPYNIGVSVLIPLSDVDTPQLAEENLTKPAETKAVIGTVKMVPPAEVANACLRGIAANRYHVVPGVEGKLTYYGIRLLPALAHWVIDRAHLSSLRKRASHVNG